MNAVKINIERPKITTGVKDFVNGEIPKIITIIDCLSRHERGDWGNISTEEQKLNNQMVDRKEFVKSVYTVFDKTIWVITEAGHDVTKVMMPEEWPC